jgi:hypothetical protein
LGNAGLTKILELDLLKTSTRLNPGMDLGIRECRTQAWHRSWKNNGAGPNPGMDLGLK